MLSDSQINRINAAIEADIEEMNQRKAAKVKIPELREQIARLTEELQELLALDHLGRMSQGNVTTVMQQIFSEQADGL